MNSEDILLYACVDGESEGASTEDSHASEIPEQYTSTATSDIMNEVNNSDVSTQNTTEQNTSTENNSPTEIDLDGEKISLEDIRKYKQGYDSYSKQVNQYKDLQNKSKEAIELYDYLQSNQELAKKLYEFDKELQEGNSGLKDKMPTPEKQALDSMRRDLTLMQIDAQLEKFKAQDENFDEVNVLRIATENNVNLDLAYKIWKGENAEQRIKDELDKQSKNITKSIQESKKTKTLITETNEGTVDDSYGLSEIEQVYAQKLGMTNQEYAKWKK